jgi:hypothetical protein
MPTPLTNIIKEGSDKKLRDIVLSVTNRDGEIEEFNWYLMNKYFLSRQLALLKGLKGEAESKTIVEGQKIKIKIKDKSEHIVANNDLALGFNLALTSIIELLNKTIGELEQNGN